MLVPLVLSLTIPMIFEFLLPSMCTNWQRANRRKLGLRLIIFCLL